MANEVFCKTCGLYVVPERHFGLGTVLITFVTYGLWVVTLPFYPKKCPYCKGLNFRRY